MAAISRIIALPSSTNYNVVGLTLDYVEQRVFPEHGDWANIRARIAWTLPAENSFKNALNSYYAGGYRVKSRIVLSGNPNYQVYDDVNLSLYTSPYDMGARAYFISSNNNPFIYDFTAETTENGETVVGPIKFFNPQTKPATAPTPTLTASAYPGGGIFTATWSNTNFDPTSTTQKSWGNAQVSDRHWVISVWRSDGMFIGSSQTFNQNATTLQYNGSFLSTGQYYVILYAKNSAGFGTGTQSANVSFTAQPITPFFPPFFPRFGPFFPYFGAI